MGFPMLLKTNNVTHMTIVDSSNAKILVLMSTPQYSTVCHSDTPHHLTELSPGNVQVNY